MVFSDWNANGKQDPGEALLASIPVLLSELGVSTTSTAGEFTFINDEMTYRFRDVYDHLVRLSEESLIFQDRVTSILDAHLSSVSNRLNEQMKVLTLVTTIAIPFTVLGGLFGMNVHLPGISDQNNPHAFWWILSGSVGLLAVLIVVLRRFRLL